MGKRLKIGDIIEIPTAKGFSYALYTHRDLQWGALLRVFDGFFERRPADFGSLVQRALRFSCFFPLQQAVNQSIVSVVANGQVPEELQEFPTFRSGPIDPITRKVSNWWLWDGREQWQVPMLSPKQLTFPFREVVNDTLLINRIESGWAPEEEADD